MEYPPLPGSTHLSTAYHAHVQALLRDARSLVDGATAAGDAWRGAHPFSVVRRGERNAVLRARLSGFEDGAAADGRSIVLKLVANAPDPDLADADLRCMLALTGTGVTADVIAELGEAGGFAMADLGDETLAVRLAQGTAADVHHGMLRVAQAYARLHVEGRALLERTEAMRQAAMTRELGTWMDGLPRALAWVGLSPDDARVRRAISRISAVWYAGRETVTLTHGDPAPSNTIFLPDGEARLVDFEYAAPRHPAYDVTAWDVLCPLPNDVVQAFRAEYARSRAALDWPVEGDGAAFDAIVAFRALALLAWLPATARQSDSSWVEQWSVRQAVLHTLEQLADRCAGDGELERVADAAREAAARWRKTWPEVVDAWPPWPAFRSALA